MATTQYIGARYVPLFFSNPDDNSNNWKSGLAYDPLTVVTDLNQSYTSKITVPASVGRPSENSAYWILTGAYNAQVEQYRQEVETLADSVEQEVETLTDSVDAIGYVITDPTPAETIINDAAAIQRDIILYVASNIILSNDVTFPDNIVGVIGCGGIITNPSANERHSIGFAPRTFFYSANRLFDQYCRVVSSGAGLLEGVARPQWWGAVPGIANNIRVPVDTCMFSDFSTIRFTPGIYVCYPSNNKSNRTFIFDDGAIIDGVFHLATGDSAAATVKNVHVKGTATSTVRVGFYDCDNVYVDSIRILARNSQYINQTAEGGPRGVHIYYRSHNIHIGTIRVDETASVYGVGIDLGTETGGPGQIYIDRIHIVNATSNVPGVYIQGSDVHIRDIQDDNDTVAHSILQLASASYCEIGSVHGSGPSLEFVGKVHLGGACKMITIQQIRLYSANVATDSVALSTNGNSNAGDCFVGLLDSSGYATIIRNVSFSRLVIASLVGARQTTVTTESEATHAYLKDWTA